jgi:DNA-binding ferritin-like protein (Dps family)
MASHQSIRFPRVTPTGKNALKIQKKINQDYAQLGRDYKKLMIELWHNPTTKWILGGVVLTSVIPLIVKALNADKDEVYIIRSREDIRDFDSMNA